MFWSMSSIPAIGKDEGISSDVLKAIDTLDHKHFMGLAIDQARKVPDCPFGAVARTPAIIKGKPAAAATMRKARRRVG